MRFIKMHGIGNDYVYVNGFVETVGDPAALAEEIADRHTGVGGDGLILVLPPEDGVDAHVRMRMFNADGSESEMCGNGIRCVCKLAYDHEVAPGIREAKPMKIQTGAGVLTLEYTTNGSGRVEQVTVDMGAPILEPEKVPVILPRPHAAPSGRKPPPTTELAYHLLHATLFHLFHHLLHLFVLLEQAVDILHLQARATGNTALAPPPSSIFPWASMSPSISRSSPWPMPG